VIKSTIVLNPDDTFTSSLSTAAVEPDRSATCTAPVASAAVSSQPPDLRIVDMDHVSVPEAHTPIIASNQARESAATIRITSSSHSRSHSHIDAPGLSNLAASPPDLSAVSSPSLSPSVQNALATAPIAACERQLLSFFSLFGIDVESHVQSQCLVFGNAAGNMWRHFWFRSAAVLNFLAVFVFSLFIQLPRNSVLMLCSLWTLVIMFSLFLLSLIDMRIVSELARTFEFWFLQFLNLVSFVAACSSLVNEADGRAAFVGNDRMLQLLNDICWSFIYFMGCAIIVMSDALSVRRGIKIFLNLFWITTMVRVIWWRIWFSYEQPYTLPLDVCIWIECFSVQVIRLQTSMTFAVFAAKYAFSLFRFPRALVILKSAVVMSVVGDDTNQGLAGACAPVNVIAECDAVMAVAEVPDREEQVQRKA
jgi:hypothetical protein